MPESNNNPSPFDRSTRIRIDIVAAFIALLIIAVALILWLP